MSPFQQEFFLQIKQNVHKLRTEPLQTHGMRGSHWLRTWNSDESIVLGSRENPCVPPVMDLMLKLRTVISPDRLFCNNLMVTRFCELQLLVVASHPSGWVGLQTFRFDIFALFKHFKLPLPYLEFFTTSTSPLPRCPEDIADHHCNGYLCLFAFVTQFLIFFMADLSTKAGKLWNGSQGLIFSTSQKAKNILMPNSNPFIVSSGMSQSFDKHKLIKGSDSIRW